jgi:RNA polymerase sigma factor (sigma-70 family)
MTTTLKPNLLGHLRGAFLKRELTELSDAQLLTRYLVDREDAVFETIVRRHGGMVFGVCQRILGNRHDAEDAFQATFMVLVRKARAIVARERLAAWLHGVAQRTAMKARTTRARWQARGQQAMTQPSANADADGAWSALRPVLDEELAALADIYRLPIVLCDLEGKSRKEAAGQLGWLEGTLSGRLCRGRRLLAARLARRGVALSTAGLATVLAPHALALPPPELLAATVKAASLVASGQTMTAGIISAKAALLTEGVLKTMLLARLKTATAIVLVVGLVTGGLGGLTYRTFATQPGEGEQVLPRAGKKVIAGGREKARADLAAAEAAVKKAQTELDRARANLERLKAALASRVAGTPQGKIYMHRSHTLTIYDLKQKTFSDLPQLDEEHQFNYQDLSARLSPDGRFLAFGQAEMGRPPSKIQVRAVDNNDPPRVVVSMPGKELSSWCWSPDGKRLSFSVWGDVPDKYAPYVVDIATGKTHRVQLPALKGRGPEGFGSGIDAWSPDGLWLVFGKGHFHLVNPETKDARQITTEPTGFLAGTCRFSPDGKKVLFIGVTKTQEYNLSVIDLLLRQTRVVATLPKKWSFSACWSPDSRHIALSCTEVEADFKRSGPCRLEIRDADGRGRPQLVREEADGWLTVTDWRE